MKKYLVDLLERTLATFAQGFLAVLIAQHGSANEKTALYTGLTAGGLAVGKFILVKANTFLTSSEPAAPSIEDIAKAVEATLLTLSAKAGTATPKKFEVPAPVQVPVPIEVPPPPA
jgi:hypothetical protein